MEDNLKAGDWPEAGGFQLINKPAFPQQIGFQPLQTFVKRGLSPAGKRLKWKGP